MDIVGQWASVVAIVLAYAACLGSLLLWERFRALVVGYGKHRRGASEEPVVLPYVVASWVGITAGVLAFARDYTVAQEASTGAMPPPAPNVVKLPGSLGSSLHAFFSVGWLTGLAVFGTPVNTWQLYATVCVYQLTRAVLGSMVANIFTPFYGDIINSTRRVPWVTMKNALVGHALTRVFLWWSLLTDVLISSSQLDLALFTLVATVCADAGYGYMRIVDINSSMAPESPVRGALIASMDVQPPPAMPPPPPPEVVMSTPAARRRSRSPGNKTYGAIQLVIGTDRIYDRR